MPNDETNHGYTDPNDKTAPDTNAIPTNESEAEIALDKMFQEEPDENVLPQEPQQHEEEAAEQQGQDEGEPTDNPESEDGRQTDDSEGEGQDGDESADAEEPDNAADADDKDEDAVPEGLFNEKQQAVFQKAIGKVKGKLQTARAELESAKTKAAELESLKMAAEGELMRIKAEGVVPPPTPDNPLVGVINSEQQLNGYKAVQFNLREQIKNTLNEDGAVVFVDGRQVQLTPEQAKAELGRIDRFFDLDLPRVEQHIRSSQVYDAKLFEAFPDAAKPNTPVSLAINSIIASNPVVKKIPGYHAASFLYAVGQMAVQKWGIKEAWDVVNGDGVPPAAKNASQPVKTVKAKAVAKAISRVPPPPPAKKNTPKIQGIPKAKIPDGPLSAEDADNALETIL